MLFCRLDLFMYLANDQRPYRSDTNMVDNMTVVAFGKELEFGDFQRDVSDPCRENGYSGRWSRWPMLYPLHAVTECIDERVNTKMFYERGSPAVSRRFGSWLLA